MMSERFYIHCADDNNKQLFDTESDFNIHIEEVGGDEDLLIQLCDLLNEQQSIIRRDKMSIQTMMSNMKKLEEKNEQLRKENVFLAKQRSYWKSKCAEWMGVKEENLSLRCVKMSDERFKSKYYLKGKQGVVLGVVKVNEEENVLHWNEVVELLNRLNDENERLRKELDSFKPVMFQDMQKGTVRLYSKGGNDE